MLQAITAIICEIIVAAAAPAAFIPSGPTSRKSRAILIIPAAATKTRGDLVSPTPRNMAAITLYATMNGSPRKQNTAAMVEAFAEGAKAAGHEVETIQVGKLKINGCLACEYCHGKGEGKCVQKDDMEKVMPAYMDCDMIVFASPIYYFDMTAQLSAAIQRVYAIGKPPKAMEAALLPSSASPNPFEGAIATYKNMLAFMGIEDKGIFTAAGEENGSKKKLAAIREFAKTL